MGRNPTVSSVGYSQGRAGVYLKANYSKICVSVESLAVANNNLTKLKSRQCDQLFLKQCPLSLPEPSIQVPVGT